MRKETKEIRKGIREILDAEKRAIEFSNDCGKCFCFDRILRKKHSNLLNIVDIARDCFVEKFGDLINLERINAIICQLLLITFPDNLSLAEQLAVSTILAVAH